MGSVKREKRLKRNNKLKEVVKADGRLLEACMELRYEVEHPDKDADIVVAGGFFRRKDPEEIKAIEVDGLVVGYKIEPCSPLEMNVYFDRYVYVRAPGYRLSDFSLREIAIMKYSLYEAFFQPQQSQIHMEVIGQGAFLLWQRFMVVFAYKYQNATIQVPKEYKG